MLSKRVINKKYGISNNSVKRRGVFKNKRSLSKYKFGGSNESKKQNRRKSKQKKTESGGRGRGGNVYNSIKDIKYLKDNGTLENISNAMATTNNMASNTFNVKVVVSNINSLYNQDKKTHAQEGLDTDILVFEYKQKQKQSIREILKLLDVEGTNTHFLKNRIVVRKNKVYIPVIVHDVKTIKGVYTDIIKKYASLHKQKQINLTLKKIDINKDKNNIVKILVDKFPIGLLIDSAFPLITVSQKVHNKKKMYHITALSNNTSDVEFNDEAMIYEFVEKLKMDTGVDDYDVKIIGKLHLNSVAANTPTNRAANTPMSAVANTPTNRAANTPMSTNNSAFKYEYEFIAKINGDMKKKDAVFQFIKEKMNSKNKNKKICKNQFSIVEHNKQSIYKLEKNKKTAYFVKLIYKTNIDNKLKAYLNLHQKTLDHCFGYTKKKGDKIRSGLSIGLETFSIQLKPNVIPNFDNYMIQPNNNKVTLGPIISSYKTSSEGDTLYFIHVSKKIIDTLIKSNTNNSNLKPNQTNETNDMNQILDMIRKILVDNGVINLREDVTGFNNECWEWLGNQNNDMQIYHTIESFVEQAVNHYIETYDKRFVPSEDSFKDMVKKYINNDYIESNMNDEERTHFEKCINGIGKNKAIFENYLDTYCLKGFQKINEKFTSTESGINHQTYNHQNNQQYIDPFEDPSFKEEKRVTFSFS